MRILSIVLLAALAASAETAWQQAYDVTSLTPSIPHHPGRRLGFDAVMPQGIEGMWDTEEDGAILTGDSLVALVQACVAPGTWGEDPNAVSYDNGLLHVTHGRAAHEKTKELLAFLRSRLARTMVVEADVVALAPGVLEDGAGALLSPERMRAVDAALTDPKRGRLLATLRAVGLERERVHVEAGGGQSYLRDVDLQIANRQSIADPVIGVEREGSVLDVQAFLTPDERSALLVVRFSSADLVSLAAFETGDKALGAVELPESTRSQVRTAVVVPLDRSVLLTAGGWAGGEPGWITAVIVRAGVRRNEAAPEPAWEGPMHGKVIRAQALTRYVTGFAGPRLGLGIPDEDTAVGATFVLDEPEEGVALNIESLIEMVRANVAPDSWDADGASIADTGAGDLLVVQTPEVLAQVEAFLSRVAASRADSISVESWLVAMTDEAWLRHREALAGSEVGTPAWDAILADAGKNAGVRIAGSVRGAGQNGTRWHAARGVTRAYVSDYDAEVATGISGLDAVVSVLAEGVSLDVRALLAGDGKQVRLDLRPSIALATPFSLFEMKPGGARIQQASVVDIGFEAQTMVTAGKVTLAGMSRRDDGDRKEMLVLFVRARPLGE